MCGKCGRKLTCYNGLKEAHCWNYLPPASCHASMTVFYSDINKGVGKGEYWDTAEDYRDTRTSSSTVVAGNIASTGTSSGTASSRFTVNTTSVISPQAFQYLTQKYGLSIPYTGLLPELLPVEQREEPIRAWRAAKGVRVCNGHVIFQSTNYGEYAMDDRAVCAKNHLHHWVDIPVVECSCGFYSMKPEYATKSIGGVAVMTEYPLVLEVELYGRVLEAEYGYRSQFQKVLGVYSDGEWEELPGVKIRPSYAAFSIINQQREES